MKAALDSHQRDLEWDHDSAVQQCEAQATRAIQEAESLCAVTIQEVEAHCKATIKEAEDHCTAQVHDLQQSHREDILNFEHEAWEKEECTHLSFLEACGAALGLSCEGAWDIIVSLPAPHGYHTASLHNCCSTASSPSKRSPINSPPPSASEVKRREVPHGAQRKLLGGLSLGH